MFCPPEMESHAEEAVAPEAATEHAGRIERGGSGESGAGDPLSTSGRKLKTKGANTTMLNRARLVKEEANNVCQTVQQQYLDELKSIMRAHGLAATFITRMKRSAKFRQRQVAPLDAEAGAVGVVAPSASSDSLAALAGVPSEVHNDRDSTEPSSLSAKPLRPWEAESVKGEVAKELARLGDEETNRGLPHAAAATGPAEASEGEEADVEAEAGAVVETPSRSDAGMLRTDSADSPFASDRPYKHCMSLQTRAIPIAQFRSSSSLGRTSSDTSDLAEAVSSVTRQRDMRPRSGGGLDRLSRGGKTALGRKTSMNRAGQQPQWEWQRKGSAWLEQLSGTIGQWRSDGERGSVHHGQRPSLDWLWLELRARRHHWSRSSEAAFLEREREKVALLVEEIMAWRAPGEAEVLPAVGELLRRFEDCLALYPSARGTYNAHPDLHRCEPRVAALTAWRRGQKQLRELRARVELWAGQEATELSRLRSFVTRTLERLVALRRRLTEHEQELRKVALPCLDGDREALVACMRELWPLTAAAMRRVTADMGHLCEVNVRGQRLHVRSASVGQETDVFEGSDSFRRTATIRSAPVSQSHLSNRDMAHYAVQEAKDLLRLYIDIKQGLSSVTDDIVDEDVENCAFSCFQKYMEVLGAWSVWEPRLRIGRLVERLHDEWRDAAQLKAFVCGGDRLFVATFAALAGRALDHMQTIIASLEGSWHEPAPDRQINKLEMVHASLMKVLEFALDVANGLKLAAVFEIDDHDALVTTLEESAHVLVRLPAAQGEAQRQGGTAAHAGAVLILADHRIAQHRDALAAALRALASPAIHPPAPGYLLSVPAVSDRVWHGAEISMGAGEVCGWPALHPPQKCACLQDRVRDLESLAREQSASTVRLMTTSASLLDEARGEFEILVQDSAVLVEDKAGVGREALAGYDTIARAEMDLVERLFGDVRQLQEEEMDWMAMESSGCAHVHEPALLQQVYERLLDFVEELLDKEPNLLPDVNPSLLRLVDEAVETAGRGLGNLQELLDPSPEESADANGAAAAADNDLPSWKASGEQRPGVVVVSGASTGETLAEIALASGDRIEELRAAAAERRMLWVQETRNSFLAPARGGNEAREASGRAVGSSGSLARCRGERRHGPIAKRGLPDVSVIETTGEQVASCVHSVLDMIERVLNMAEEFDFDETTGKLLSLALRWSDFVVLCLRRTPEQITEQWVEAMESQAAASQRFVLHFCQLFMSELSEEQFVMLKQHTEEICEQVIDRLRILRSQATSARERDNGGSPSDGPQFRPLPGDDDHDLGNDPSGLHGANGAAMSAQGFMDPDEKRRTALREQHILGRVLDRSDSTERRTESPSAQLQAWRDMVESSPVTIFTTSRTVIPATAVACQRVRDLLASKFVAVVEVNLDATPERRAQLEALTGTTSRKLPLPQVFIGGQHIGGEEELMALEKDRRLDPMLNAAQHGVIAGDSRRGADDLLQHLLQSSDMKYEELEMLGMIGEGSYGKVYYARWRETEVAVKVLNNVMEESKLVVSFEKEAAIMRTLRHPHVVMFMGMVRDPSSESPRLAIVTEYCARGSLYDLIKRYRKQGPAKLDWRLRLQMLLDAAKGMNCLHAREHPIIHRDLKSANLLVHAKGMVKVCDFNLSRVMEGSHIVASAQVTSPRWLAPEILKNLPYDQSADVYSFGVIMWEMLTLEVPWEHLGTWQVIHAVAEVGKTLPVPDVIEPPLDGSQQYVALMQDCWKSAKLRPSFSDIIVRLRDHLDMLVGAAAAAARRAEASAAGGAPP